MGRAVAARWRSLRAHKAADTLYLSLAAAHKITIRLFILRQMDLAFVSLFGYATRFGFRAIGSFLDLDRYNRFRRGLETSRKTKGVGP